MTELHWSDVLVLDLPSMDETHREFVDLLGAVSNASDTDLVAAWAALVERTADHFGQEDSWMRQTGFASGNCHSTQHKVVLSVMREGWVQGRSGRFDVVRRMADELAVWFPQHAQSMDAALALHLRSVEFDFDSGTAAAPAGHGGPCRLQPGGQAPARRRLPHARSVGERGGRRIRRGRLVQPRCHEHGRRAQRGQQEGQQAKGQLRSGRHRGTPLALKTAP